MKPLLLCLVLAGHSLAQSPAVNTTTAAKAPDKEVIAKNDSRTYLSEHLLGRFNEPRLDARAMHLHAVIRLTILRAKKAPVMLTWHPQGRDGTSTLHVKMLKVNRSGATTSYSDVTLDRKITLTEAQTKSLKAVYAMAPIQSLPSEPWQSESMHDSLWVYEAAAGKRCFLLCRRNPADPDLNPEPLPKTRLVKEMQLTSFGLTLWTIANIDQRPY